MPPPPRTAQAALVERHWAAVRAYLRVLGADPATADDLAQDVFVDAIRKSIGERGAPTRAWLQRAARFAWSRERRGSGRRPWPWSRARMDSAIEEAVWSAGEAQFEAHRAALQQCLGLLTERVQAALALFYGQCAGREAVASELGMAPGGVKTLLRRARRTLRECVERAAGPLGGAERRTGSSSDPHIGQEER